jgi:hypothetical protein
MEGLIRTLAAVPEKTDTFYEQAIEGLHFLEENEGPQTLQGYVETLTRIQAELNRRILTAVDAYLI